MRERAVTFGSHGGLMGVVTEAEGGGPGPRRGVLLSNIGTHHKVGPYRMYADLARRLAAVGYHVLRFDLSGLGDSEPRTGALGDEERMLLDVREAMQWLSEKYAVEQFVLIGLCSGVTPAHGVATADARVVGAVFIDGYVYSTPGSLLRRYTVRYLEFGRWRRFGRRRLAALTAGTRRSAAARAETRAGAEGDDGGPPTSLYSRPDPPIEQFRADVARMTARGTKLLFVFTGTIAMGYNARRQLFEMLGRGASRRGIEVDLAGAADHLFTGLESRARLLDRITEWARAVDAGGVSAERQAR